MDDGAVASASMVPDETRLEMGEERSYEMPVDAPATPEASGHAPDDRVPSNDQAFVIDSFAAMADHAKTTRDGRLYHHLMEDVRLVAFRPGHLEIRPEDSAPSDLANNLRRKLEAWTGDAWAVVINSQAEGQAPLAAQQRQAEADILADTENDPLVKAVLDTFPGAKVTNVRPLGESGDDSEGAAPAQTNTSNGMEQR
ncbi:MAG: hypothetical protein H8E30_01975 [Alphaproteobacteria bacterium]|nr:hypothetical protein [Alphaproteobacteria bacterium]